jgi:hypothetical protein
MRYRVNRSKFSSVMTTVDGIKFRSKAEARRYGELKLLEKAGEIHSLRLQPVFDLNVVGGFVKDVVTKVGRYVADFDYFDVRADTRIIEDVKGFKTPLYRWKKRHVEAQYGITITEVK